MPAKPTKYGIKQGSLRICFLMEQSVPISSNMFWGNPFFEKGPPKITEGGSDDPHRQVSRISPDKGVDGG